VEVPAIDEAEDEKLDSDDEPEVVTLKEVLAREDVKEFVKKIRKQEKDKLYDEIDKRDGKIKTLEGELSTIRATLNDKEKAVVDAQVKFEAQLKMMSDKITALEESGKKKDLTLYLERALAEAGDDLILALVKGDSQEEIDESIELAKDEYKAIALKVSGNRVPAPVPETPKKKVVPTTSTNPVVNASTKISPEDIKNMSQEDWAKNREAIKRNMGLK